jgi:hypothetical protein
MQFPCGKQEKLCAADYKCYGRLDIFLLCIDSSFKGTTSGSTGSNYWGNYFSDRMSL